MNRKSDQKTKRRRTVKLPRRNATAPASRTSDKKKIGLLTRELSESLERETATSQVLDIISSSPTDLQPVFETILANATRLCEAKIGILFRYEDGLYTALKADSSVQAGNINRRGQRRSAKAETASQALPLVTGPTCLAVDAEDAEHGADQNDPKKTTRILAMRVKGAGIRRIVSELGVGDAVDGRSGCDSRNPIRKRLERCPPSIETGVRNHRHLHLLRGGGSPWRAREKTDGAGESFCEVPPWPGRRSFSV
jgi:hypothetical protein